jgi:hypothetical protein
MKKGRAARLVRKIIFANGAEAVLPWDGSKEADKARGVTAVFLEYYTDRAVLLPGKGRKG